MPAPTAYTNSDRVARCVQYLLEQINHDNYFYTDGMVVDRGRDPTNFSGDKADQFRKLGVGAGIGLSAGREIEVADPRGLTAGIRSQIVTYPIMCMVQLTPEQRANGVTLDTLVAQVIDDIRNAVENLKVKQAAAILAIDDPLGFSQVSADGSRVSCVNHRVIGVNAAPITWPTAEFDVIFEYSYARHVNRTT